MPMLSLGFGTLIKSVWTMLAGQGKTPTAVIYSTMQRITYKQVKKGAFDGSKLVLKEGQNSFAGFGIQINFSKQNFFVILRILLAIQEFSEFLKYLIFGALIKHCCCCVSSQKRFLKKMERSRWQNFMKRTYVSFPFMWDRIANKNKQVRIFAYYKTNFVRFNLLQFQIWHIPCFENGSPKVAFSWPFFRGMRPVSDVNFLHNVVFEGALRQLNSIHLSSVEKRTSIK